MEISPFTTLRLFTVVALVAGIVASPSVDRSRKHPFPCHHYHVIDDCTTVQSAPDGPLSSDEVVNPGLKDLIGNCQDMPIN
jgi:hypothetical protein